MQANILYIRVILADQSVILPVRLDAVKACPGGTLCCNTSGSVKIELFLFRNSHNFFTLHKDTDDHKRVFCRLSLRVSNGFKNLSFI